MGNKSLRVSPVRAALAGLALAALPMASFAYVSVGVSINIAPPALPVYVQPPCPEVGYIWTPGYWAWDDGDYYWVPGTWVSAPSVGLLWTPGYWGWGDGGYFGYRLLGTSCRFLRWYQLRLRIHRCWLPGRLLARAGFLLQPVGFKPARCSRHQRL